MHRIVIRRLPSLAGSPSSLSVLQILLAHPFVSCTLTNVKWAIAQHSHEILIHVTRPKKVRADFKERDRVFNCFRITRSHPITCVVSAARKCQRFIIVVKIIARQFSSGTLLWPFVSFGKCFVNAPVQLCDSRCVSLNLLSEVHASSWCKNE